jgi:hypothetical protein
LSSSRCPPGARAGRGAIPHRPHHARTTPAIPTERLPAASRPSSPAVLPMAPAHCSAPPVAQSDEACAAVTTMAEARRPAPLPPIQRPAKVCGLLLESSRTALLDSFHHPPPCPLPDVQRRRCHRRQF